MNFAGPTKYSDLRMLRLHGERIADIVLAEPEANSPVVDFDEGSLPASLELRNVSFRYADGDPLIIDGLSLVVRAGESIAITGPSGCGKTTLL